MTWRRKCNECDWTKAQARSLLGQGRAAFAKSECLAGAPRPQALAYSFASPFRSVADGRLVSSAIRVGSARREFWFGLDGGVGVSRASVPQ